MFEGIVKFIGSPTFSKSGRNCMGKQTDKIVRRVSVTVGTLLGLFIAITSQLYPEKFALWFGPDALGYPVPLWVGLLLFFGLIWYFSDARLDRDSEIEGFSRGNSNDPSPSPATPTSVNLGSTQRSKQLRESSVEGILAKGEVEADMSFKQVIARVQAKLGDVPHAGKQLTPARRADRSRYFDKLDLEIADRVYANKMHVWARNAGRPRTQLRRLDQLHFRTRSGQIMVQGDAVRPMVFEDVMFNRAEVEAVWPQTT